MININKKIKSNNKKINFKDFINVILKKIYKTI